MSMQNGGGAVTANEMDEMLNSAFQEYDTDNTGYVDARELASLCQLLKTPLNTEQDMYGRSEVDLAVEKLDTDGSGRIELFEFKNWWLGKIVFQDNVGGTGGKLNKVADEGRNRLLKAKLARKQAEADAQLLANRIALLQQEEAKAWKKIQQTKVRACEILKTRETHERDEQSKAEHKFQEGETNRKAQESRFVQKQREKAKRQKAQAEMIKTKQASVRGTRQMRRENEIEMQRQKQADQERARYNREVVRAHEDKVRKDLQQHQSRVKQLNADGYEERVVRENSRTGEKESEVQSMEKQEMELIQRLQNAQMLQKEAYEQLETALSGATV